MIDPTLVQYGIVGACAAFVVHQSFKFARWIICRRDAKERGHAPPPSPDANLDPRIGQILDRLTTIETQLTERDKAQERAFALIQGIDNRLRTQENQTAFIQGKTNGRGA